METAVSTVVSADEVNAQYRLVIEAAGNTVQMAVRLGEMLIAVKSSLKHGEFMPWVEDNCEFSQMQATRYMNLHRANLTRALNLDGATSIRGALEAIADEKERALPRPLPLEYTEPDNAAEADESPSIAPEPSTVAETEYICECGEVFNIEVWHCPICDHHWPMSREDCWNCHGVEDPLETAPKPHVAHNSGENEWYTPGDIIELARDVMGGIDLDPASSDIAQKTVNAEMYYTKEDSGLDHRWAGRVWMNPPYASNLIGEFVGQLCDYIDSGEVTQAVVLVNNATETAWFQKLGVRASAICFPARRVRFLAPDGTPGAPLQGQAILYFGTNGEGFKESFEHRGFTL